MERSYLLVAVGYLPGPNQTFSFQAKCLGCGCTSGVVKPALTAIVAACPECGRRLIFAPPSVEASSRSELRRLESQESSSPSKSVALLERSLNRDPAVHPQEPQPAAELNQDEPWLTLKEWRKLGVPTTVSPYHVACRYRELFGCNPHVRENSPCHAYTYRDLAMVGALEPGQKRPPNLY